MDYLNHWGDYVRKGLKSLGVVLLAAWGGTQSAEAVITVAHNFPKEDDWTFGHEMTQSQTDPNVWTTTIAITGCLHGTEASSTAWFTFFDGNVAGWNEGNSNRFGAGDSEPIIVSGVEYDAVKNNERCFIVNQDGTYDITLRLTDNGTKAKITFTRTGDYNPNIDPIPDPDPVPDPDPTVEACIYFYNTNNISPLYFYAWNDDGPVSAGWPGDLAGSPDEEGWYKWTAPEGKTPKSIIISAGSEGTKVGGGDLEFKNGWYYLGNGTISQTKPTVDPIDPPNPPIVDPEDPSSNFVDGVFIPSETDAKYKEFFPTDKEYVFFVNDGNWDDPHVWAWNDNANATGGIWPGESMQQYKGNVYVWVNQTDVRPIQLIISTNNGNTKAGGDLDFYNHATYYKDGSHKGGTIIVPPQPTENAGPVSDWKFENGVVEVTCEKATLYITPYSDKVVKVFTLPTGSTEQERRSITVVATPDENLNVTVDENEYNVIISVNGTDLQVGVDKETGLLSFVEGLSQKLKENHYLDNVTHTVNFEPQNDIAFYGGGPSSIKGSIKDETIVMNNYQKWGWNSDWQGEHNIEIPFVVSTSNYGLLFDDHYRYAKMRPSSAGVAYESGSQTPISYYYIGGDNLDEVVANYTSLTGRQPLPPYWTLGYITSRYGYYSFEEGDQVINGILSQNIPLDGIVYDLYWQGDDEFHLGTLNWGEQFPNPTEKLAEWKREKGVHTILITEPYFTDRCTNWNFLVNSDYLADKHVFDNGNMNWLHPTQDVGLLDASNPEALDWMYQFYKDRTAEGVDGWWLDLGEPEGYDDDSDTHHKGGTPKQVHNEFGQLWVGHIHDCLTRDFPDMRHFLMPRAGTSGMQRYSAFPWTGDIERSWSGFKAQVPSLTNMAMAGFSFLGSDVGGFACTGNREYTVPQLYLRWIQFGALSPMLRTHSKVSPEPYHNDYSSVVDNVRKAIRLRYRMLPYVYTLAYENSAFGYPMARPACAFDQNKSLLAENNDSYMWGRDLFVAPILSENNTRDITFPEGEWADMNDVLEGNKPETYVGHAQVSYTASNDHIPFFIRKGGFVPMFTQTEFNSTSDLSYDELTIYHYFDYDQEHQSILYEDDRTSPNAIKDGKYSVTKFISQHIADEFFHIQVQQEGDESILPETRTLHLYCFGFVGENIDGMKVTIPESVESARARKTPGIATFADDEEVVEDPLADIKALRKESLEEAQATEGHAIYHNSETGMLYVKAHKVPTTGNIQIVMGAVPTAITDVMQSAVTLNYSGGTLNYSVDANAKEATIEIYSADGRLLSTVAPTVFNGHVNAIDAPQAEGFCIAKLTARDAYGNVKTATCKYFVK